MSIVNTPKKYLSNVYGKYYMRKVRTSSVRSSSTLFSCSIHAMYNRFNSAKNLCLKLKSYNIDINSLICIKRHYDNIFYEIVNELHYWIEKQPHEIQYPNISDSLFVKINGNLVKKQKYLLQI